MSELPCEHLIASIIYKQWRLMYSRKYPHFTLEKAVNQIVADEEKKVVSFQQVKQAYADANEDFYELFVEWLVFNTESSHIRPGWVKLYDGPQYCNICLKILKDNLRIKNQP